MYRVSATIAPRHEPLLLSFLWTQSDCWFFFLRFFPDFYFVSSPKSPMFVIPHAQYCVLGKGCDASRALFLAVFFDNGKQNLMGR